MKNSTPAHVQRHAVILVTDDHALGDTIKDRLTEEGIEVTQVHDPVVALGMLDARPEAGLLLTEIAVHHDTQQALAFMVRSLIPGIGIVFMTARPHLIEAIGQSRGKAFVKPVELAELAPEIRVRLAD